MWGWFSVNWSDLSGCLYFVFEDVAPVIWSCWSYDVPPVVGCVPSNFRPTHEVVVKLNWVILCWSCGDIDKVPCTPSDVSPPCCLQIYEGYISFSSVVN